MRRGDFAGTVVPIYTCLHRGCVVWDRHVGQIRKLNICNRAVPVEGSLYTYLPWDGQRWSGLQSWTGTSYASWAGPTAVITDAGRSPLFQDILGDGRQIRAYIETPLDAGKSITIFGLDNGNQPLTSKGIGSWNAGITVKLAAPYVTFTVSGSAVDVRSISRIVKDLTKGRVRLYAYNVADAVLEDLVTIDSSDQSPNFLRQTLSTSCCGSSQGALALVKLAFVPVIDDNDLVIIQNQDALKLQIQSILASEANDFEMQRQYEVEAIRELNLELRDITPEETTPVSLGEVPNCVGFQALF
jgi:hypothetical protein